MPSPYELRTRWLEWHERWPVPDIESLKRQIETVRREIHRLEGESRALDMDDTETFNRIDESITGLFEVLATLERLMPPF